jgi:hypothetical protein
VEEQRTPVGTPLSLSNQDTVLSQPTPVQRRHERPSAATSSVSWKQWTPAEVASFVRGLTSDFGEKSNVYAETLFKEDIDGDVLANLSPGNLKELGLSLSDSFNCCSVSRKGFLRSDICRQKRRSSPRCPRLCTVPRKHQYCKVSTGQAL